MAKSLVSCFFDSRCRKDQNIIVEYMTTIFYALLNVINSTVWLLPVTSSYYPLLLLHLFQNRIFFFGGGVKWHSLFNAGCLSCLLYNSVKAVKDTQITDCSQ